MYKWFIFLAVRNCYRYIVKRKFCIVFKDSNLYNKKILKLLFLALLVMASASPCFAVQLSITNDGSIGPGGTLSTNTNFDGNSGNGILSSTNNTGNPWVVALLANITASNNSTRGVFINTSGNVAIDGGGFNITTSDNADTGVFARGELTIKNANITADANDGQGITAFFGGKLIIKSDTVNTLTTTNTTALTGIGAGIRSYDNSLIDITNMNIISTGNTYGVVSDGIDSNLVITGNGSTSLDISSNNRGMVANSGSDISIKDMNITSNNNSNVGITVSDAGSVLDISSTTTNTLAVQNSGYYGIYAADSGEINITNMNIIASNPAGSQRQGIYANTGGSINILGSGTQTFTANSNTINGIYATGKDASDVASLIHIKDMASVTVNNNAAAGIAVTDGGSVLIENSGTVTANGNTTGLHVDGDGSILEFKDTNFVSTLSSASAAIGYVALVENGGALKFSSSDYSHTININQPYATGGRYGFEIKGVGSSVYVENMGINAKTLGTGGYRSITVSDGASFTAINDDPTKNLTFSTYGSPSPLIRGAGSSMYIENYDVIGGSGTTEAFTVESGGHLTIKSDGSKTIDLSSIGYRAIIVSGVGSAVDIEQMNVYANATNKLLNIDTGGIINITGKADGTNTMIAKSTTGSYHYIIESRGNNSSINIANMDIDIEVRTSASGSGGIRSWADSGANASKVNITGVSGVDDGFGNDKNNSLVVLGGSRSIVSYYGGFVNITDMNVDLDDAGHALHLENRATMNIIGKTLGENTLDITNMSTSAISLIKGAVGTVTSKLNIIDMNTNITSSNRGIFVDGRNEVLIGRSTSNTSASPTTLNISNITTDGILATASNYYAEADKSLIDIIDMNVTMNNNVNAVNVETKSDITFSSSTGTNSLTLNNNTGTGLWANHADALITVQDMNVLADGNKYALQASQGGKIQIINTKPTVYTKTFQATNNTQYGLYASGDASGYGVIVISNMNVNVSDNAERGIMASSEGQIHITGDGTNTLTVSNNRTSGISTNGYGVLSTGADSVVYIKDMQTITVENNGLSGLYASQGGLIKIEGKAGQTNILYAKNNNLEGTTSENLNSQGSNSYLEILNTSIEAEGGGIRGYNGGAVAITGKAAGGDYITINGGAIQSVADSGQPASSVQIKNMDVSINNTTGVNIIRNGTVSMIGVDDNTYNNKLIITGASARGLDATSGTLNIQNMDIKISDSPESLIVNNSAKVYITGKTGYGNTYELGAGSNHMVYMQNSAVEVYIHNMNLISTESTLPSAIILATAGSLQITGVAGQGDQITFSHAGKATATGQAIYAGSDGIVNIANMNFTMDDNRHSFRVNGGTINVVGATNGSNTLSMTNGASNNGSFNSSDVIVENGGKITFQDMTISTMNNSRGSGFYVTEGEINIVSSNSTAKSLTSNSSRDYALQAVGADSKINVAGMNITFNANQKNAIIAENGAQVNISGYGATRRSLVMNDSTTGLAALVTGSDSELNITSMDISSNTDVFKLETGTKLNLANSTLTGENGKKVFQMDTASILIDNMSDIVSNGTEMFHVTNGVNTILIDNYSEVSAGTDALLNISGGSTVNLTGDNSSVMYGKINITPTNTINVTLKNNAAWHIMDASQINSLDIDNGKVFLSDAPNKYNVLTIADLSGYGTFYFNSNFNNSTVDSDVLSIIDSVNLSDSNPVKLYVNVGSITNPNDIVDKLKIISAPMAIDTGTMTFALVGGTDILDVGGFEYNLIKGSGGDPQSWYLLNTRNALTGSAKTLANEPAILLNMAKTGMNSLNKRMGELRNFSISNTEGAWVRTYAKHMVVDDLIGTELNTYGIEAGYDHQFDLDGYNRFYVGLMAGYLYSDPLKTAQDNGGKDGRGRATMPTVGIYATWLAGNGWFIDAVARTFWSSIDLTTYTPANDPIEFSFDRQITAASIEIGKQIEFYKDRYSRWILEPKAEVMVTYAKAKSFRSSTGNYVRFGDTGSAVGKAGALFGYYKTFKNCSVIQPYVQASLISEFTGDTTIDYAQAQYKSDMNGLGFEVGGGVNYQMTLHSNVYAEFNYEIGSVVEAVSGNLGFRHSW